MTSKPASDIQIDLSVDGVFVRRLVITAAEIAALPEASARGGGDPPRVYQDVVLPQGDRMAINLMRYHPGRDSVAIYTADGRLVNEDSCAINTTRYLYSDRSRPKPSHQPPEEPPDEPHVSG